MRNVIGALLVAAVSLVYFRSLLSVRHDDDIWSMRYEEYETNNLRYHNCTLSSCFDLQQCMRNYSRLTVYIQPLIRIENESGFPISPAPSTEFLEIREALEPYSVRDPSAACLFIPGVDFLNENVFNSSASFASTVTMVTKRWKNVVVFSFIGTAPRSSLTIGATPPSSSFRHQFDISAPLLLPPYVSLPRYLTHTLELLVPLVNVSALVRLETEKSLTAVENIRFIVECASDVTRLCDSDDKPVSSDWDSLVSSARLVLLLDSAPLFPRLLSVSLLHGSVPVIISSERVLPFPELISWNRISLRPSSVSRVPSILERLNAEHVRAMSTEGRTTFDRYLSSATVIALSAFRILESRILPTRTHMDKSISRGSGNKCAPLLPHLSPSTSFTAILVSGDDSVVSQVNSICSSSSTLSNVLVLWTSTSPPPDAARWKCSRPLVVLLDPSSSSFSRLSSIIPSTSLPIPSQSVLLITNASCPVDHENLDDAFSIWRSNPHSLVRLPILRPGCLSAKLTHLSYFSLCPQLLNEDLPANSSRLLPEIQLERRNGEADGTHHSITGIPRVLI